MSNRQAALRKPNRPSGLALHFSVPTPACHWQQALPDLHRCTQTLSQGSAACKGAVHSLLVSTFVFQLQPRYCSSLVLSASHHQRTPHLRGERHAVQLVRPLVFFSTLRTGSHLTEDSHGKDVGIKLLTGHENTANDHLFFSQTHRLIPGSLYFKIKAVSESQKIRLKSHPSLTCLQIHASA